MIESFIKLIELKNLKNLTLINFCDNGLNCFSSSNFNKLENLNSFQIIINSLNKLMKFSINNLNYLKLVNFDFIINSKLFLSELENNNSTKLKILILKFKNILKDFENDEKCNFNLNNIKTMFDYLISKVFTSPNSTINHFKISIYNDLQFQLINYFFTTLLNYKDKLNNNLYSISVSFNNIIQFNQLINFINSLSLSRKVKEFNLKNLNNIKINKKIILIENVKRNLKLFFP
ncbi:hypothetical protein ACTFIZ_008149 [Dictyostelium cf. discoideum]